MSETIIKKKLKDVTFEEFEKWKDNTCAYRQSCDDCLFVSVSCSTLPTRCWTKYKDLYSNKFLNKEIVTKSDILTTKEKEYLSLEIQSIRNEVYGFMKIPVPPSDWIMIV